MIKTEDRPKAPKTPSPGQMRAAAAFLADQDDDGTLQAEAMQIVRDWLRYQATLKAAAR
jgi:hypothetical protein